ncbi:MAG: sel1 repeat family protein [Proteobacteria bacterium]|nr:sel1 repeat family protein [Pseudomonadota bacterium]
MVTIRKLRLVLAALATLVLIQPAAAVDYADGNFALNHISLEAAVRIWRKAAWQNNDFLAQAKLGDIYDNASDSRYYDPVEAYVWYFLAARNRTARRGYWDDEAADIIGARRARAWAKQGEILLTLSTEERVQARNRIVYILSCRGAEGFIDLGRITRTNNDDDDGWRRGRRGGGSYNNDSAIVPNDADALIYFHIADALGSPLGRAYLNPVEGDLRRSAIGAKLVEKQARDFHFWFPPYEFYPEGDAPGGVPLSDECLPNLEHQRALILASAIPAPAGLHALAFLGFRGRGAIAQFQASLAEEPSDRLTAAELVRAIQMAAQNGDAESQNTLGVMYSKGTGVVINYARAEYWFQKAADQRYAAALYHLGVLYKVGPPGIDQDLHKANDYMTSSALAGFRPTMNQLGALLNAAAAQPPRPGQN